MDRHTTMTLALAPSHLVNRWWRYRLYRTQSREPDDVQRNFDGVEGTPGYLRPLLGVPREREQRDHVVEGLTVNMSRCTTGLHNHRAFEVLKTIELYKAEDKFKSQGRG
jgi:hypothetical protein